MNKGKNSAILQPIKWSNDTESVKESNYQIRSLELVLILY